jgi:preprotein translocase subunit SecD
MDPEIPPAKDGCGVEGWEDFGSWGEENELGLGLDLQGGMHVVLEVSPSEIIR